MAKKMNDRPKIWFLRWKKLGSKNQKIIPKQIKTEFYKQQKIWTIVQIFGRTANGVMWFCGGWGFDLQGVSGGMDSWGHVHWTC